MISDGTWKMLQRMSIARGERTYGSSPHVARPPHLLDKAGFVGVFARPGIYDDASEDVDVSFSQGGFLVERGTEDRRCLFYEYVYLQAGVSVGR